MKEKTKQKTAVVALVTNGDKVLVGRKSRDKEDGFSKGIWHIPGESIEDGESEEDALTRGVLEEAGVSVIVENNIDTHENPNGILVKWYLCKTQSSEIRPGDDLDDVRWVTKSEAVSLCDDRAKEVWPDRVKEFFELK